MKRTSGAVAMFGIAALLLSACGGGDDEPTDTTSADAGDAGDAGDDGAEESADAGDGAEETEAAGGEEEEEAPVRDQSAELVIWADDVRAPILTEFADQFGEEFGVTVQVQVATDVREQFKNATNVDQGPDVIVGAHDWLGELVQNGTVSPIQMSEDVQAAFVPEALEATKFDGQIYGVPYATESLGLIRNTALAPDEPESMEALVAHGKELVESGEAEEVMLSPVGQTGDAYNAFPWLSAYGGGIFGLNDEGGWDADNVIVGSDETIQGGEKMAWLAEEGALNVNVGHDNLEALFSEGKSAYVIGGPWTIAAAEGAGIDYAISPIPDFEDGGETVPFLGVQMFYVSSKAKNPTLAQEFVNKYVPNADLQVALYEAGDRPPALQEALDTVSAEDEDIAAWATAGEGAPPMPNIPAMNSVWGPLGQATSDIVGGDDPAERLTAAQDEIVSAIG
ncbi:sugar ABC transporter substrate-binding protein [Ornithinicoccus hortensis]|uniref:Carbohydrate ABC transporter substrate-binding protein (CUT1 family) n=1 Tax=Ornithinicoccus hortensis TaxID=82346 RepID=A0A542YPK2_9MICO|nr:maltose ABC transporter substrate-binding protein [Ornithinicoccus hortensis]TQL49854.1 carbohydrate ABC transporter substrate-binding protein (CUT1 family) [Ornithinicoccus hortensis]